MWVNLCPDLRCPPRPGCRAASGLGALCMNTADSHTNPGRSTRCPHPPRPSALTHPSVVYPLFLGSQTTVTNSAPPSPVGLSSPRPHGPHPRLDVSRLNHATPLVINSHDTHLLNCHRHPGTAPPPAPPPTLRSCTSLRMLSRRCVAASSLRSCSPISSCRLQGRAGAEGRKGAGSASEWVCRPTPRGFVAWRRSPRQAGWG